LARELNALDGCLVASLPIFNRPTIVGCAGELHDAAALQDDGDDVKMMSTSTRGLHLLQRDSAGKCPLVSNPTVQQGITCVFTM
jgi:hypothetical protein